ESAHSITSSARPMSGSGMVRPSIDLREGRSQNFRAVRPWVARTECNKEQRGPRFEEIPKTKLQASSASDPETLQSQDTKTARKRLSLRGLEVLHGRLDTGAVARGHRASFQVFQVFKFFKRASKIKALDFCPFALETR